MTLVRTREIQLEYPMSEADRVFSGSLTSRFIAYFQNTESEIAMDRRKIRNALHANVSDKKALFVTWGEQKSEEEVRAHVVRVEIATLERIPIFDIEMLARFAGPESVRKLKQDMLELLEFETRQDDYTELVLRALKFADYKVPDGVNWSYLALKFPGIGAEQPFELDMEGHVEVMELNKEVSKFGPPNIS